MIKKLTFLVICSIVNLQCAQIKYYNAAPKSDRVSMKRAELIFLNGDVLKLDDIIVDSAKGILYTAESDTVAFSHALSELQSLRYSNYDLSPAGLAGGFLIGALIGNASGGNSRSSDIGNDPGPPKALTIIGAGMFCGLFGFVIGEEISVYWKSFDLAPYKKR